jgi:hypothetical protein
MKGTPIAQRTASAILMRFAVYNILAKNVAAAVVVGLHLFLLAED